MNRQHIALLIAAGLAVAAAVALFYSFVMVEEVHTIPAHARFSGDEGVVGFNVALDALTFGTLPADAPSYRSFNVTHGKPYPLQASVSAKGPLARYLRITPRTFTVHPGGAQRVEVVARFPEGTAIGNYTGTLAVTFTKVI